MIAKIQHCTGVAAGIGERSSVPAQPDIAMNSCCNALPDTYLEVLNDWATTHYTIQICINTENMMKSRIAYNES